MVTPHCWFPADDFWSKTVVSVEEGMLSGIEENTLVVVGVKMVNGVGVEVREVGIVGIVVDGVNLVKLAPQSSSMDTCMIVDNEIKKKKSQG